ncbi:MAG TPA: hypothetical protein VKA70_02385 [Blastocatellia bacterium]|nr:hypothetical protein [Blastocatellia bacterium]
MFRTGQSKRFAFKHHVAIGIGVTVLMIVAITIGINKKAVVGNSSTDDANSRNKAVIEKVANSSDLPLATDNSEGSPLFILTANVKEVTDDDYQQLTGIKENSLNHITFPNVILVNNANQPVKEFTLCLVHKHSDRKECIMRTNLEIGPSRDFSVEAVTWAGPRKAMMRKFSKKEGVFQEDKSRPGLDSQEMWLPGNVSDYTLVVASVELANGNKWVTKR